jgi:ribosome-binding protein aMBF1 (putative translation factor)
MKPPQTIQQAIAERVRFYRLQQGITQTELARRIKKKKQCINRMETGKYDLQFSTLCSVATGLGISCSHLLDGGFPYPTCYQAGSRKKKKNGNSEK